MILATSALLAVLRGGGDMEQFATVIHSADICRLSVISYVELTLMIDGQLGPEGTRQADHFIRRAAIELESVSVEQGRIARQAFFDFGTGRHRAGLNFGDCFAYALAKAFDEPLLFKSGGFEHTDVESALSLSAANDKP
jgi:ribonuclease VapC